MFVVAENLKYAVTQISKEIPATTPIYMGGALTQAPRRRQRFCGGGSGYTLNREALRVLVSRFDVIEECWPNHRAPDEDRIVANCLRPIVNCTHDVDAVHETRYHALTPDFHAKWTQKESANWDPEGLLAFHGIRATYKEGLESISSTTVSFHLVDTISMVREEWNTIFHYRDSGLRRFHAIVHGLCP